VFGTPEKIDVETGRAPTRSPRVGRDRKTLVKAEAVVEAAAADPAKYGKLKDDMDRTGRVDGPFKRLQNMQAVRRRSATRSRRCPATGRTAPASSTSLAGRSRRSRAHRRAAATIPIRR
jgi:hypothetical protein